MISRAAAARRLLSTSFVNFGVSTQSTAHESQLRVCVVGSGPAGFYTANQLVKRNNPIHVDILDKFPVPFGLVRFGVAPDHAEIKNCMKLFTALAKTKKCRFIGKVALGQDISLSQLRPHYHAIVLAYGAEEGKVLGIPGEDSPGFYSARSFFGWYNGFPEYRELNPDLSGEIAVIIGHGNVALDLARMLLTPVDTLKKTDMCSHAVEALAESTVRCVHLVGRGGPLQVAFTIKELREMTNIPGCTTYIDPSYFKQVIPLLPGLPRARRRMTELMVKITNEGKKRGDGKECYLSFLQSPVEIHPSPTTGRVSSVRLRTNTLKGSWESAEIVPTAEFEDLKCDLVLRSIGYKTIQIDEEIPLDSATGTIANTAGRVVNGDKTFIPGLYCSGWAKTGPMGVILNNINKSYETADAIREDFVNGRLPEPEGGDLLDMLQNELGVETVSFSDWEAIDRHEISEGERRNKPREKIVDLETLMNMIYANR